MKSGNSEITLQSKHDLVCHVPKVKASTAAHSQAVDPARPKYQM